MGLTVAAVHAVLSSLVWMYLPWLNDGAQDNLAFQWFGT